jgi:predicted enzyme related to lactoylglutathione lyase
MIHVSDVQRGLAWYQQAFPSAIRTLASGTDFEILVLDGVQLEVVLSDEKVSSGAAGSVVYWSVGNLAIALQHMRSVGTSLYRGPIQIEHGLGM